MGEVLLTFVLHGPDGSKLAGPAMIKAAPTVLLSRVGATFARWVHLPDSALAFHLNGQPLQMSLSIQQAGLASGNAVTASIVQPGVALDAAACAAPFAMLDVQDSELSAMMSGGLGVGS